MEEKKILREIEVLKGELQVLGMNHDKKHDMNLFAIGCITSIFLVFFVLLFQFESDIPLFILGGVWVFFLCLIIRGFYKEIKKDTESYNNINDLITKKYKLLGVNINKLIEELRIK